MTKIHIIPMPPMYGYIHQPDAVLAQVNPVSATPYTVLATTPFVRIRSAVVSVTWAVQPTPLQLDITIDGNVIKHIIANPASGSYYGLDQNVSISANAPANQELVLDFSSTKPPMPMYEGKSVKVEAVTTGGTVSALNARLKWAQKGLYQ